MLYVITNSLAFDGVPNALQFYNLVLFMSSIAVFSLVAQRMSGQRTVMS